MRVLLAVFLGGVIGTGLRLGLDSLLPHTPAQFPVSTLAINVVGSFALGTLVASRWGRMSQLTRAAVGPGLLGSFTTFSAVVGSTLTMPSALLYLALTLVLGFGAALGGLILGRRLASRSAGRA